MVVNAADYASTASAKGATPNIFRKKVSSFSCVKFLHDVSSAVPVLYFRILFRFHLVLSEVQFL